MLFSMRRQMENIGMHWNKLDVLARNGFSSYPRQQLLYPHPLVDQSWIEVGSRENSSRNINIKLFIFLMILITDANILTISGGIGLYICSCLSTPLTNFNPMLHFYTHWKRQKIKGGINTLTLPCFFFLLFVACEAWLIQLTIYTQECASWSCYKISKKCQIDNRYFWIKIKNYTQS